MMSYNSDCQWTLVGKNKPKRDENYFQFHNHKIFKESIIKYLTKILLQYRHTIIVDNINTFYQHETIRPRQSMKLSNT